MNYKKIAFVPQGEHCTKCDLLKKGLVVGYPYCNFFKRPLDKDENGILKNYKCFEEEK